ncbi:hypothetical protein [Nostoc sp. CMAA1605]|uniref:hypothetical protein n=1 Tax=Nostoc sp. CMAA1605 TaxID=2055159 RepID=UPI001F1ACE42|nr:hypothetical protein [Nostoc sp. CMAA1605]MCF4969801.1 hypothetical protein [Nostoc sp. CMAA1605]
MSQDKPPESTNKSSSRSQPRPRTVQPIWKGIILQILRGTIGILETTVEKLETPSTETTPGFWRSLESKWSRFLLKQVRPFLPSNLSTKVTDTALTGIIASVLAVIVVWTTTTVFTKKPTQIATVPPAQEVPTPTPTTTPTPQSTTPPEPQPSAEITPTPEAELTPEPEPTPEPTPTPEPELTPEPTPTPEPTSTPRIELTPEQRLIAAIETQVAEISDAYVSGIIESIQANFRSSSLTVKIKDDWYNLPESQQNQLAADILQRSQKLDFAHLEIIDSQERLVARNPVIGTEMIIFQRRTTI